MCGEACVCPCSAVCMCLRACAVECHTFRVAVFNPRHAGCIWTQRVKSSGPTRVRPRSTMIFHKHRILNITLILHWSISSDFFKFRCKLWRNITFDCKEIWTWKFHQTKVYGLTFKYLWPVWVGELGGTSHTYPKFDARKFQLYLFSRWHEVIFAKLIFC